jgi:CMP-N-acetylneuraminic acid synthetase
MVWRTYQRVVRKLKVQAVIVARGGSKRIPNKNMKCLAGMPLIRWAIDAAIDSELIDTICISTDSDEYGEYAESQGVKYIKRPGCLSGDESDISEATQHAYDGESDYVVTLQAAVPLRPLGAIDSLLGEVISKGSNGGLSMIRRSPWIWHVDGDRSSTWWNESAYPRSQTINWGYFEEVNAIQVASAGVVKMGERWGYPMSIVELPSWCSVDIDNEKDLEDANEYVGAILPLYHKKRGYNTFTVER